MLNSKLPKVLNHKLNLGGFFKTLKCLNSDDGFCYHGIWIWSGGQGSGKTVGMMHTLCWMHEMFPDAIIVSDIKLIGIDYIPYTGIEQLENINNGTKGIIFVFDEIQVLYSSLKSKNMDDSELFVWSQNRKNRRVILGTSQRFTRVAKPIREQCRYHIECKNSVLSFFRYSIFDGYDYNDDGEYVGEKPKQHVYVPNVKVLEKFDTREVVKPV